LHAVIGIQAALLHREKTGVGQQIDISLLDSQVAVLANQALNYLVGGNVPQRLGNSHPNIVPYQTFESADGHIIIAVGNDRQYAEFCTVIGAPHLATDDMFRTNRSRVENRDQLVPQIASFMKAKTTAAWVVALEKAAVPCGPINSIDQVFDNPQVLARGLQLELMRQEGAKIPGVANPIRFSASPVAYDRPPPQLGQDTESVLRDMLEIDETSLAAMQANGIIA
jgi:crotonobetainyl-CoA:carnitine CoA-transferase CaiB-like acyl-CoA transferase